MNNKERKNYKEILSCLIMPNMKKRGQLAIFIIIAIVIVSIVILGVIFFPRLTQIFAAELSPNAFLTTCVEQDVKNSISLLSEQGGYSNPEGFALYQDKKIKYLCYTDKYYETCVVQQPLIKNHFESELESTVTPRANQCARELIEEYQSRGYTVSSDSIDSSVSVIPGRIEIAIDAPMTITKDTTQTFNTFNLAIESELYDLLMLSSSIVEFESTYGDSETSLYLQWYPDLKIDKIKRDDGTTIYTLTNVVTEESFTFASRSQAWPPGYGIDA